jgi:predicted transposase YbfD/YdcC
MTRKESKTTRVSFLEHFRNVPDPRQSSKVHFPLDEIFLLVLCAVISGADGWVEVAAWGKKKLDFLRQFLPYAHGTPSHDQLGNIFAVLDAKAFRQCFIEWVQSLQQALKGVVAIDGKTLRRAFDQGGDSGYIHMVSAWSSEQQLVLGQTKVAEKSNEITAIPVLLDLLTLEGAIVTIDAMGCQREIAQKIIDKKANYILALKGNQGTLRDDVERLLQQQKAHGYALQTVDQFASVDKDHGRLETRKITVLDDVAPLQKTHQWPGLQSLIMVEYHSSGGAVRSETRYYIASLKASAADLGIFIRDHWGIENGLHWVMDMVFRDDECRIRTENAPANFATIKHAASNLLRTSEGKQSLQLKRHLAAWDTDFLHKVISR